MHFHRVQVTRHCGRVTSHQLEILQLDKKTAPRGARQACHHGARVGTAPWERAVRFPFQQPHLRVEVLITSTTLLANWRRRDMQELQRLMLYLQCLEVFAAHAVLFAVRASHSVMELSFGVLEQLSQDAVTSLGKQTQFDDVPRDLLAGAPWEVALAKPWRTTSHIDPSVLRAAKLGSIWSIAKTPRNTHWRALFVCLCVGVQPCRGAPETIHQAATAQTHTHAILMRVGTHTLA